MATKQEMEQRVADLESRTESMEKEITGVSSGGWVLKYHTRRAQWIVENAFGGRWGWDTREAAEMWLRARGIVAKCLADEAPSLKVTSSKTERRRTKQASQQKGG
jgi:hypothetical protein